MKHFFRYSCPRIAATLLAIVLTLASVAGSVAVATGSAPAFASEKSAGKVASTAITPVNINTASPSELAAALNGVGLRKAKAIVRYREQYGEFVSVDQLSEVKGIGARTVERNRSVLRIR